MLPKDFQVLPEDVQNWQPLHRVLTAFAEAIKELQERIGGPTEDGKPEPEKPESEKENAPTDTGTTPPADSDD